MALRLYKSMAREAEQDDLEVDVASEIMCYAQYVVLLILIHVNV